MRDIKVARPLLPPAERLLPYLRQVDSNRWYSNWGPLVMELERRLAVHFGTAPEELVTVANGTLGLSLALMAKKAPAGDYVMMTSWTFTATPLSALSAGLVFNVLTIALPKIVDEGMVKDVPLVLVGSVATAVLLCGALAQLAIGRLVEWFAPHYLFAVVTALGFLGNLWASYADGIPLMIALAIAIAAIYAQVTVNDMILARYTADAWRGRVYAVRYFTLFISSAIAIGMIAFLHKTGGFGLVLGANAAVAFLMFLSTVALVVMIVNIEGRQVEMQPAE